MTLAASLLAALLLAAAPMTAQDAAAPAKPAGTPMVGDPYPLDTCIVSGEKLGADATVVVLSGQRDPLQNGRQLKFCCPKCEAAFAAEPAKYVRDLDAKIIAAQARSYPIDHCLVMPDEKLDDGAKTVVYGNRLYRLCCPKCVRKFGQDPAKWAAAYEKEVIAAQKPGYPLATCPISGKPLGDGAVDVVIGSRLVRACCPGCVGPIKADPAAALAKVDAAKKG
jgi:YHS domain-containing protein